MGSRKAGLGFILVTLFLDILGIGLIVPVLPNLLKHFVAGDTSRAAYLVSAVSASFALMQFLFSPVLGSLSDRFGRRPVLLLSVFGQAAAYVVMALSDGVAWIFVARIIAGIFAASISTATAYIADISAPERRAANFGLVGMAFGLGFIAGPVTGGQLGSIDIHLPFAVAAALAAGNGLYGLWVLPESLDAAHRRPFSWARANPVGTLLTLKRYPAVLGLVASYFLASVAQRGMENVWVLYTEHRYHWDIRGASYSLGAVGLGAALVQGGVVRRVLPSLGERKALLFGLGLACCSFALYGLADRGWMVYAIIPLGSLGGFAQPAAQGLMSRAVPVDEQGLLQGGVASMVSVSQVLAPFLGASLFGYFISPAAPVHLPGASFFAGSTLMLLALLLAARTFARTPQVQPAPTAVSPER